MPKPSRTPSAKKPSTPAVRQPIPGDIYIQRSADTGRYCAYQVTHTYPAPNDSLALLSLDWVGEAPPTDAQLRAARPLNNTRYWSDHRLDHRNIEPPVPATYQHVGNYPLATKAKTNSFGGWSSPQYQAAELEANWRARDPERLRRFEAARGSGREFEIAGYPARDTYTHAGPELLDRLTDLAALDKLPRLLEIEAAAPRPDLIAYLRTHDLLYRLKWCNHGQRTLDFRGVPHLNTLELDAAGLETLHVHDTLHILKLTGTLHPRLRIHSADKGARLFLEAPPAIAAPGRPDIGLPALHGLRISAISDLDLAPIVARHPELYRLVLDGKPGTLRNFAAIARLPELRSLMLDDLFGYTPADIPPPGTHPRLNTLWLESLPADTAAHVKKLYAPLKKNGLDLTVTKPRAPEWLAENLDNPFRAWDGDEFVPAAQARKAADLYRKTLSALNAHLATPDATPASIQAHLETLVRDWAAAFNKWDKRTNWIETDERETICEVVENLVIHAARLCAERFPHAAKIDTAALTDIFDELRDF